MGNLPCVYFLKVKSKNATDSTQIIISDIVATVKHISKESFRHKRNEKNERVVEVLYMTIKSQKAFELEKAILKAV